MAMFTLVLTGIGSQSGHTENYVWTTWENESVHIELCEEKGVCDPIRSFVTELHSMPELHEAERLMGQRAKDALMIEAQIAPRSAPRICEAVEAATVLGFNPELWEQSDKAKALVGLEGIYLNVENLKGPVAYGPNFGLDLQDAVNERFSYAGLKLLTMEEMEKAPGKPEMNVYFSNTDSNTGCRFRLFAGLSQTMLLTRNHTIKLKAGSWGMTGGWVADDPEIDEFRSIMIVIDTFLADWREANRMDKSAQ
ncbi:MAG: hypothetical protein AAF198_10945 [Pseudomonadota bacterium]